METPWILQFGATLRRNFLIKIRDASQTFQEIFLPVYIIALLVLVKLIQPETDIRATPWQPKVDALCQSTTPGSQGVCQNLNRRMASETMLAYVPQGNGLVDEFISEMVREFGKEYLSPVLIPQSFTSEDDLVDYYKSNPGTIYAALILEDIRNVVEFPKDLYYRIRINGTYVPSLQEREAGRDVCRQGFYKCSANEYLTSGFLALQSVVSKAARKIALPKSPCSQKNNSKGIFAQQQPIPSYHLSFASSMFQLFTAMYMVWALVPQLQTVLYHIVKEKEDLVKDCMLVMGLRESVYWMTWLLTYATMSAFTSLILVLTAKITTLFAMSDTRIVFLLIYSYSVSLISMAFALSTIFSKVRTAMTMSGALMILGSFTIIPVDLLQWSPTICAFLSLFSPVGLALGMNVIVRAEGVGEGLNFHNLWSTSVGTETGDNNSHLSAGTIICILGVDTALYILIAWYLDNAWPHPDRGSKRPWSFVISKEYWFKNRASHVLEQESDDRRHDRNTAIDMSEDVESNEACEVENSNVEQVEPILASKVVVKLKNLRKVYSEHKKWWGFWSFDHGTSLRSKRQIQREVEAVKGLNLNLYDGECFAIAGHSGSGKSSVIYMLSRLSCCTSGEAYIHGHPITAGGTELKSIVSVCPKNNICIGLLTAREQLQYFGTIKGRRWDFRKPEGLRKTSVKFQIDELLKELNLSEEADKQARYLNPSARRKLSLALALIGDPQVVLMDQPTADLDLDSKKQFWNLIQKLHDQFLFVFTTDSMEEADVVADRKAILSHGVLKCCGSSLFLRKRFGLSYSLHITRGENYNSERVLRLVQSHIADVIPIYGPNWQAHATFRIPLGSSAQMASLLMDLTMNSAEFGVGGGDLEATTLEEIYMKFQDEGEDEAATLEYISEGKNFEDVDSESESLLADRISRLADPRTSLLKMQILSLLSTRFCLYRRNIGSTLTTVGLPSVLMLVVLIVQLWIGKSGPAVLHLYDRRIGQSIPLYYTTHNKSSVSDAQFLLDILGTNHVLLDESSLLNRFDVSEPANQRGMDAVGVSFDQLDIASCSLQYTVMYQPWHAHQLPTVAAMLDNAFLQLLNANYSGKPQLNVHVGNHPLPYYNGDVGPSLMIVFVTAMGLLLIPPILGAQVVHDRQLGLVNLFHVSGMRSLAYWVANFLTDIVLLYVASMVTMILGVSFGFSPFIKEAIPIIMFLMMVILPALLLLSYVLSFMFGTAQGAMSMLSLFFLLIAIIPYFVIIIIPGGLSFSGWHFFLCIVDPAYALISSLHMVVTCIDKIKGQNGLVPSSASNVFYLFRWDNSVTPSILGSAVSIVLLFMCLWRLEAHISSPELRDEETHFVEEGSDSFREDQETEDIQQEKERVLASLASWEDPYSEHNSEEHLGYPIVCCHLSKKFRTSTGANNSPSDQEKWALQNIWLAVQQGEIVVLIGGENAGKSTLLHCIGRETPITSGDALIRGNSVRYNFWATQQNIIGFCPQFELMYQSLTLREHLKLFASLKGLANPHNIPVDAILNALHLTDEADKRIRHCKASIHRKLAVATAMLGDPSILLLDEPTYGLDMASRRKVWTHIAAQSNTRATLICTQSFQEAEALGDRVGILLNGQLKCLAAPQELKQRYGSSYSLLVVAEPDKMTAINEFIYTLFAHSPEEIKHENSSNSPVTGHGGQRRFQIPIRNLAQLAMLLHELEAKRHTFGIKDYVVSQPTLQQVFHQISHAREGTNHT